MEGDQHPWVVRVVRHCLVLESGLNQQSRVYIDSPGKAFEASGWQGVQENLAHGDRGLQSA